MSAVFRTKVADHRIARLDMAGAFLLPALGAADDLA
jgi:hypothetical protein